MSHNRYLMLCSVVLIFMGGCAHISEKERKEIDQVLLQVKEAGARHAAGLMTPSEPTTAELVAMNTEVISILEKAASLNAFSGQTRVLIENWADSLRIVVFVHSIWIREDRDRASATPEEIRILEIALKRATESERSLYVLLN